MAEQNNSGNIAIIVILLLIIIFWGFYFLSWNEVADTDTGNSINVELPEVPQGEWE